MIKFTIEGELPSANEIIAIAKRHPMAYSSLKKKSTDIVRFSCLTIPKIKTPAIFIITYYCKNKRKDLDNIAFAKKFLFDGLIKAGKLENDGWGEIKSWEEHFEIDKKNPRIEVEVKNTKSLV